MSTCRWCTPGGSVTTELLRQYAAKDLSSEDFIGANDDLSYCMECVVEYHRARGEAPQLHKALWTLETSRLIEQLDKSVQEEIEEDDELYLVEEDGEKQLFGYTGPNFESNVRVPLLEILRFPYLLLSKDVTKLCVDALCKMEQANNSFQVFDKLPGVYLLLVHSNETIRRWAILTARSQGKVDRDDYYDLEEVFTCLFKVIELGLFENPDLYMCSGLEDGKLILLPSHLYDTSNYKNYWLGICMLLTVLEEQALDSLLLGPDKQNDFMQSILHVMEKHMEDESRNPFWPALHCFMTILDRLGSKVWGQLIDPIQAFQTIVESPSYKNEIENIRNSCQRPTKHEPDPEDEDMVSCSQAVYNFNTEKVKKDTSWKSAICPEYCPNMYEDMQSLANILQSDIGQDMRVHDSTFLWFIPYVQSVMDLKDLGVAYIMEVIHHLYSEIKDVFTLRSNQCDTVTELFIRVLVSIIELHRSKKCLQLLWITSHKWVDAIVRCALLPVKDHTFRSSNSRISSTSALSSSPTSQSSSSVQFACIQLIRSLLREGCQLGQQATCKSYLDKFNLLIRGNVLRNLELGKTEVQGLESCLKQIIRSIKDRANCVPNVEMATPDRAQAVPFIKTERIDEDDMWYGAGIPSSVISPAAATNHEGVFPFPIKKEPLNDAVKEVKPNISTVVSSSGLKTSIKKENLDDVSNLSSAQEAPKKMLPGWKSKLSEVLAKSACAKSKNISVASERDISSEERAIPGVKPCFVQMKKENNLFLEGKSDSTESDSDESTSASSDSVLNNHDKCMQTSPDNLLVSDQLKRMSLENEPGNRPIKKEPGSLDTDCVMDSETEDDDLPLTEIKKRLLHKNDKTVMPTNLDHNLNSIPVFGHDKVFNEDPNKEGSASQDFYPIKRKVKGTTRSMASDHYSSKEESNEIITISDDDSDKEEDSCCKSIKVEKQEPFSDPTNSIPRKNTIKSEPDYANFDEYESQCFEFETEEDIYSAWTDSQLEEQKPSLVHKKQSPKPEKETGNLETSKIDLASDQENEVDQWGYDTEFICDDVIEKAAEEAERQFRASTSAVNTEAGHSKPSEVLGNSDKFYEKLLPKTSTETVKSDSKSKQSDVSKKLSSLHTKNKAPEKPAAQKKPLPTKKTKPISPLKAQGHIRKITSPGKTGLAVVPPKKIRTNPEPTSVAEKLFLKKAPRKAFDLSQRTLDSLEKLRNHGMHAGFVEAKKAKSKLISPQSLLVKSNKKMLACQDLQFYRQSRPKNSEKKKQRGDSEISSLNGSAPTKPTSNMLSKRTSVQSKKSRNEKPDKPQKQKSVEENTYETVTEKDIPLATLSPPSGLLQNNAQSASVTKAHTNDLEEEEDDDNLFLTQADPLDMDLCSQVETEICVGSPQDSSALGADNPPLLVPQVNEVKCKYKDCSETVAVPVENCPKHSFSEKAEDHVFAKPGLPPSFQRPPKPSTTKVYGTTSRTANLTKDLENLPKYPKAKTQPERPVVPARPSVPLPAQNKAQLVQSAGSVLKPLINQNNVPVKYNPTTHQAMGKGALVVSRTPRDQAYLMQEVLHWNYEMFDNISRFGTPSNLCQLPLLKVPLKFSNYDEYFNVFFPLMLLDAFESLAQEWTVKQAVMRSHLVKLHLQNFCIESQMNRGEFQAWIRDADLNMQRHPKEDDLVFLLVPECPTEENELQGHLTYHTGHVFRFTRSQQTQNFEREQYTLCDLNIRTYGNLLQYRGQQVKCVVIGSMITTQRQFKALIQLQRNPLFRPIIQPYNSDFLPRDSSVNETTLSPSLKEYNRDQKYAIEKAYAMVKQHPRLPRICLIHGPPGTGKSKTIVGLLYRILMETQSNIPDQNFNAKNKRNRVLVCAPSNAALDDLMKKIILEFKEKCHDKKNTLGNCGDINLVRLGSEKSISSDVVKFSLDCQVNYKINKTQQHPDILRRKEALDKQLDDLSRQRAMERCNKQICVDLDQKITKLRHERQIVANVLNEVRRRPQEIRKNIILESHVICCTLSTSGGFLLESAFRQLGQEPFSCVIVDEAGQSCEIETLIPLLHRCSKLVLVGDPEQLPPTVISLKAEELGYGQSLMSRFYKILEASGTSSPILQLTVQYRMHPDICLFPSNYFYKRQLKTDRSTEESRCSADWPFQPYMVFDISDGYEKKERESFSNPQEIKMVVTLIKLIKSKNIFFRKIGIITPYRAQKMLIIKELEKAFGNEARSGDVDTVDGFQGQQKDCIIVTCVRANSIQGCIGFLASKQRLNVTITRAKFSLFILGSLRTLMENKDWNHLIQDAQRRGAVVKTKEDRYNKDVNKILKFKPIEHRTSSIPPTKSGFPHTSSIMPPHPSPTESSKEVNIARPKEAQPKRTIVHPALGNPKCSGKTKDTTVPPESMPNVLNNGGVPVISSVLSEKQRDPRLARRHDQERSSIPPAGQQPRPRPNQYQSRLSQGSSSIAGVKRPSQSSSRDPRISNDNSSYSREGDYRDSRSPYDTSQDPKKRKLSL
ncbi:putative helicase senataxin [Gastrophryne carolinensis]